VVGLVFVLLLFSDVQLVAAFFYFVFWRLPYNSRVVNDSAAFKREADVTIANRSTEALADVVDKIYTHDLFGGDS